MMIEFCRFFSSCFRIIFPNLISLNEIVRIENSLTLKKNPGNKRLEKKYVKI